MIEREMSETGASATSVLRRVVERGRHLVSPSGGRVPPSQPNFLIIGAQKAGTRWLRHNLGEHPDVLTAAQELWYFDHYFDRGSEWYRRQFAGYSGETAIGESTPGYMIWGNDPHRNARRIDEQLPGARLFAVLREPADRTLSAFLHHLKRGRLSPDDDLLAYVRSRPPGEDPLQLIIGGWYAASLEPFFERFGERLCVFLNDDIRADSAGVYRTALEHLGVDPKFVPEALEESASATAPRRRATAARGSARG